MPINSCRVCGNTFFEGPLLRYENMPRAAQFLPDAESLAGDEGVSIEVYQCSGCGLVQLKNDPVLYYREVIRASAASDEMMGFRVTQFGDFVQKHALAGRKIIEIGCGRGEYLSLMQQCGAEAYGLEYAGESVERCITRGLKVSEGFVEGGGYRIEHAPFDAFYMLNFLEHLPDPNAVLKGIRNNLTHNGVGLVEVPNFDMILRKKLFSEFISDHLLYFTVDTLSTAMRSNGFELLECKEIWHDYIISAVVRKRERTDVSHFDRHRKHLANEIEDFIHRFEKEKVAIWGAGHQALAVISLSGIADKIRYVVDSAPFKQGRYTPATHVPIVSPEALDSDPVDAIIVMAAGYSDEVAKIIRRKFDRNIKVVVLRDFGLEVA